MDIFKIYVKAYLAPMWIQQFYKSTRNPELLKNFIAI